MWYSVDDVSAAMGSKSDSNETLTWTFSFGDGATQEQIDKLKQDKRYHDSVYSSGVRLGLLMGFIGTVFLLAVIKSLVS